MEIGVISIGLSGYQCLLCAGCGAYLLSVDRTMSAKGTKEFAVAKTFGWIHLIVSFVLLILLWMM